MSATKTAYKAFVGGDWVDSASGETMEVIAPATGEVIAEVPRCAAEDVDRAVEAAKKVLPEWLDKTPKDRSELLHKLADVIDDNAEELAQLESLNVGKPLMASRDEMPFGGGQPPLLRRRCAAARGEVGGRVHRGLHLDHPARAARHRRRHLPVELPADDGDLEDGAGARGGERADPEAVGADAALAAAASCSSRRRSSPRACCRSSRATAFRSASGSSRIPTCGSCR